MTEVIEIEAPEAIDIEDALEVFPLEKTEQYALHRCEAIIAGGIKVYIAVGNALLEIRDKRLYRATHGTFAGYCDQRWQMSRARAYQLIDASEVAADLSTIVDIAEIPESHMREIAKSAPEDRPRVLDRATELAGDEKRTAKHIEAATKEIAAPDLPIDFSIIQRRLSIHGVALSTKIHTGDLSYVLTDRSGAESTTRVWDQVLDRLSLLEDGMDDPPEPASDRAAYLAKEQRDAGRMERARSFIANGEIDAARTVLAGVEVATYGRDQLLASLPAADCTDQRPDAGTYANALSLLASIGACLNAGLRTDAAENTRRLLALLEATD